MSGQQVAFLVCAAIILVSAGGVVTQRNLFHAALSLVACFVGVAGLYVLLQAEFLAVAQVLIYVGAVTVLILFGIMLTRHFSGGRVPMLASYWKYALGGAVAFLSLLLYVCSSGIWPTSEQPAVDATLAIGQRLVLEYLLPFELASLILLAALVGAVLIAKDERR
ncbi:MAG: NADH-quinone oxidoreductase subunit J [Armatimonadota bacterium]|nr:NADH-quinone oxidoreductase subunit J [Armatimonadota bacterium]